MRYRTQLDSSTSCEPLRGPSPVIFPTSKFLHAVMNEFRTNGVPNPRGVTLSPIEQFPYATVCVECFDPVPVMYRGPRAGSPTLAEASPACNGVASSRNAGLSVGGVLVPHSTVHRASPNQGFSIWLEQVPHAAVWPTR